MSANPSEAALADIPPPLLEAYLATAGSCPGLPWQVMAGIGKVESDPKSEACTSVGIYELDVPDDGNRLEVTVLEDPCDARRDDFGSGLTRHAESDS